MHTKNLLADALRDVGLTEMADRAATGFYHDYLSPLATPELQLVHDLHQAALKRPDTAQSILALRRRVIDGEFDASTEESDAWAASEDGQDTFRRLIRDREKP